MIEQNSVMLQLGTEDTVAKSQVAFILIHRSGVATFTVVKFYLLLRSRLWYEKFCVLKYKLGTDEDMSPLISRKEI